MSQNAVPFIILCTFAIMLLIAYLHSTKCKFFLQSYCSKNVLEKKPEEESEFARLEPFFFNFSDRICL